MISKSQKFDQNLRKLPDFYSWFNKVAKNIEGCFRIFTFIYLACSQIWLHPPMDDCHFGYITGLTRKKHQIELGPIKKPKPSSLTN